MTDKDKSRFLTLDALRGIAAILVVFGHCGDVLGAAKPRGSLAVDFFFALSGFVLLRVYSSRFGNGLSFTRFMLARIIRLYPLYMLGTVLYLVKYGVAFAVGLPRTLDIPQVATALLSAILFLPDLNSLPAGQIYPLNFPAWSLLFELLVNATLAICLFRVNTRGLALVVAMSAVALVLVVRGFGTINVGPDWTSVWGGFIRAFFSFNVGLLMARLLAGHHKRTSYLSLVPIVILPIVMVVPTPSMELEFGLFVAIVISPAVLAAGIVTELPTVFHRAAGWLGDISYPLYVLNAPFVSVAIFAIRRFGLSPWPILIVLVAGLAIVSRILVRRFDKPVRSRLTALLIGARRPYRSPVMAK